MMLSAVVSSILLGAILNLDRQVFGPFMLNRPLVVGLLIGVAIGDFHRGVWMGLSVELLWLSVAPLGGSITPNAGLAVTAALAAWAGQGLFSGTGFPPPNEAGPLSRAALVLLFITVPVWVKVFTALDKITRLAVPRQLEAVRADLAAGREPHFFRRNIVGLGLNFVAGLAALLLAVPANMFFLKFVAIFMPPAFLASLGRAFGFIPFLGLFGMAVFLEAKTLTHYLGGLLAGLLVLSAI